MQWIDLSRVDCVVDLNPYQLRRPGLVAQLVERSPTVQSVIGSNPTLGSSFLRKKVVRDVLHVV